jgi:integrase
MQLYKRGSTWWANFWWHGKHIQFSTKVKNRRQAQGIAEARRTALAKGEVGISEQKPVPTLAEFAERFREETRSKHAGKPKTASYYDNGLNRLLEFERWRNAPLDRVDEELIDEYARRRRDAKKKTKKGNGPTIQVATLNRELEVLRRMLRLAQAWKLISRVPQIRCDRSAERQRDRVLSHAEEQMYLAAAKRPLRDVAQVILDTGMRPEEVFRIEWPNVRLQPADRSRYGYIFNPLGKTKYARRNVSMTARMQALLEMRHLEQGQPRDGWVFPAPTKSGRLESLKSQHRRALKDSGVKPFVLYTMRHTMLTRLGEAGADAFAIQNIAGHSSILISQRYVHPTPEKLERAFTALEAYNDQKRREADALKPAPTATLQ